MGILKVSNEFPVYQAKTNSKTPWTIKVSLNIGKERAEADMIRLIAT